MRRAGSPLRSRARKTVWALVLPLTVGACHSTPAGPVQREPQVIEDLTFDPSLNIDLSQMTKLPEGVYVQDLTPGTGDAVVEGDIVTATFTLWLYDGTQLDSGTYDFTISSSTVIEGFKLGMIGMQVGGTRRMIIPPDLGYGLYDRFGQDGSVLPGGSVLIFEVDLTQIK